MPLSTGPPMYQALLTVAAPVVAVFCHGLLQMSAVGGTDSCRVLGPEPSTREHQQSGCLGSGEKVWMGIVWAVHDCGHSFTGPQGKLEK